MPDVFDSRLDRGQIYRALEDALRRNADSVDALRDTGEELDRLFRAARRADAAFLGRGDGAASRWPAYPAVEAVDGIAAGQEAVERMQRAARRELRIIDMPPYHGTAENYAAQEVLQAARMAEGIAYRVVYSRAACDDPVAGPNLVRMVERGEQARTLADPPMKLVLADDDLAAVPLPADATVLLVRPSALLDALIHLFEALWRLAVPVSSDADAPLDERDRLILTLLATGATDDAIARRVGVNRRTVVRRVSALQGRLGATTRFQAGLQAGRRGWL
ncbi:helix-turn-helix domain-containing protein [Catenulispora subtropica]|uniref:HTH luxR-type domain-containing protein n=1 Tax=Catenulispora subtropica TaxID=450798 RepID=A0ABP5DRM1_9ACTN